MPRRINLLAAKTVENPRLAPGRHADGGGLYLVAEATDPGGRVTRRRWVSLYQSPTKKRRREAGFGSFPEVGLAAARAQREAWRAKVAAGVDPIEEREAEQARKQADARAAAETFGVLAE